VRFVVVGIVLEPSSLKSSRQVLFFRRFGTFLQKVLSFFLLFSLSEELSWNSLGTVVLKNVVAVVSVFIFVIIETLGFIGAISALVCRKKLLPEHIKWNWS
ncbi:20786_t:CDS:2, partial [Gigaspora rosea]